MTHSKDAWKVTMGAMVLAWGRKESTQYVTVGSRDAILFIESSHKSNMQHCKLEQMSKKGIKVLQSKGKLQGLKSVELDFYEDFVFWKEMTMSFSKVGKSMMTEKLELVHTDVQGLSTISSLES